VDVTVPRRHVEDRPPLGWTAAVHARGDRVLGVALLGAPVDVGVGPELLHDVDLDRQAGELVLRVGSSSEDLRLTGRVRLTGPDRVVGPDRVLTTPVEVCPA
jgi:hypothetical protein